MSKYKFVKAPINVAYEGYSLDISKTTAGSFVLQPTKYSRVLPKKYWMNFESVEDAEEFCDDAAGCNGISRLVTVLGNLGVERFVGWFDEETF